MSREIKFRVWKDGKMLYTDRDLIEVYFDDIPWDSSIHGDLMQFTGLKDKNGKEIYEGDIIMVNEYLNGKIWDGHCHIATVIYNCLYAAEFTFNPIWLGQKLGRNEVEIIGNIFETPELLK